MPIYEYHCEKCETEFEYFLRSKEEKIVCPECQGEEVTRKFSLFGIQGSERFKASTGGKSCSSCKASSCQGCH